MALALDLPGVKALLLGGADTLWDDVEAVEALTGGPWAGLVIACNDAGVAWPHRLDHWATLHPEHFYSLPAATGDQPPHPGWIEQRKELGHPNGFTTWARRERGLVDRLCETWGGGSSGLLCVAVAAKLGVTHAILCGIPMESRPHFNDHHRTGRADWTAADNHWRGWIRAGNQTRMEPWVRSMSGRTRATFGGPTHDWLAGPGQERAGFGPKPKR